MKTTFFGVLSVMTFVAVSATNASACTHGDQGGYNYGGGYGGYGGGYAGQSYAEGYHNGGALPSAGVLERGSLLDQPGVLERGPGLDRPGEPFKRSPLFERGTLFERGPLLDAPVSLNGPAASSSTTANTVGANFASTASPVATQAPLPKVPVGSALALDGAVFGQAKGVAQLRIGAASLPIEVLEWTNSAIKIRLPRLQLNGSTNAEIVVLRADNSLATKSGIELTGR